MALMPTARKVLHEPNPTLRKISKSVEVKKIKTKDMATLLADMVETMKKENGVGVAAPQIGINERIFIAQTNDGPKAFINPEIVERSFKVMDYEEGCLSVPGVKTKRKWGKTKRFRSVTVKALDENGEEFQMKGIGLLAVIFQHEIDHLDGILFIDHATDLQEY